jgi:hypothetical protein
MRGAMKGLIIAGQRPFSNIDIIVAQPIGNKKSPTF